jgi:hypothetical protein
VHAFSLYTITLGLAALLAVASAALALDTKKASDGTGGQKPTAAADGTGGRPRGGLYSEAARPKPAAAKATAEKSPKKLLVPPPPPETALLGGAGDGRLLSTLGVPLDYMSKTDLLSMQERLKTNEAQLSKEADDRADTLKQKRERAAQFEELFKEGVVSKRELENARKELAELNEKGPEVDLRLKDIRVDLERVKKQIAIVEAHAEKPKPKRKAKTK